MTATKIEAILNPGRMLADGIPFPDYDRARRLADTAEWYGFWADTGQRYEALGEDALSRGDLVSGGEWLWHASLSFHYAQFMWFHEPELREAGQRRKAELYQRAAAYLMPAADRIEVSFDQTTIPGYLRLPVGNGPYPCVLVLGGLESTKEESYLFENMCLRRGLATFAFDGPGQGEMFFDVKLQPDFERYASAVIDDLAARAEIDIDRLGVIGRSLGGHYALRSAAFDSRLRACVAWGAFVDMSDWEGMPPHTRDGFVYVTGKSADEAAQYLPIALDIREILDNVECLTYVLQGAHDRIFSAKQTQLLASALADKTNCELVVEADGDHCCHNMAEVVRPRMADWLSRQLLAI